MGPFFKILKRRKASIEDRIRTIKDGNAEERESLIKEYTPFIIKSITKVTNSYIEVENDDEFSIGLQAFNEAIDRYEFSKGSFVRYAETVIKNRIIDFHRKNKGLNRVISIDREISKESKVEGIVRDNHFVERYEMKEQILKLQTLLNSFNITFKELVEESPKHIDTRLNSIYIARTIIKDSDLKKDFYRKKMLPVKKIVERIGVSRKVLKGNRKFIIATALIIDSELDLLIDYISQVEGGKKNGISRISN